MQVQVTKVSKADFEKRVEIEMEYLIYEDKARGAMSKQKAREEAVKTVSQKYQAE